MQKQGSHPVGELSMDGYKVEAKSALGNFFSTMTLHPTSHAEMMLGSQVTGEFVTTKETILPPHILYFESEPEPLKKQYHGWKFMRNLAFSVELFSNIDKKTGNKISKYAAIEPEKWYNIKESALTATVIGIGATLATFLEDIALAAIVVV